MLQRHLETIVSAIFFTLFVFASPIGWLIFIYLLTTNFWWLNILCLVWLLYDINTPDSGGRQIPAILHSKVWNYCKRYLTSTVTFVPGFKLNPSRNYLFGFFPHGIIPLGPFLGLTTGVGDFHQLYPEFKVHIAMLRFILLTPYMRELVMAIGLTSCSAKGLNYLLSKPGGGNIVNLSPGGAIEAYYCRPGVYRFVVKRRKGFLKIAMKNGVPIVPVVTFGENNVFHQVENKRMVGLQEWIRKKIGFAPVVFYGRGLFENWYGWFPRRAALSTIVGMPIDVVKTENPTNQQIDDLHKVFVQEVVKLFDTYKHKFLENSQDVHLELE